LEKLPWAEVVLPRGLSFDSARNVFLHLTLVEDRWINYIEPNRFSQWKDQDFEAFRNVDSLKQYMLKVKTDTEKFLAELKPEDLNRKIAIPWAKQHITVETALTHMVMENTVHFGELSAMFWQMSLEAPYLAFCRYKITHEENNKS
jgi:uncharacterized damage-inducible protein DinB